MRRGITRWTAWAAACVVAAAPFAIADDEAPKVADVSELLPKVREKLGVPAVGGAIVGLDGVVAVGVDGVRAADEEERVTADDLWHLGSCTKAMTATLVARLAEKEKPPLALDTTIAKGLREYRRSTKKEWRDVTMAQLLGHRGGAPSDLDRDGLWATLFISMDAPRKQRKELAKTVLGWEPSPAPGTGFSYSNAGYALVGHAAELRTGTDWEELLERELFEPLGMESAGFGPPGEGEEKLTQPRGHRRMGEHWIAVPPARPIGDNPPAIGPGGTVHATLTDWGRFVAAHLRGAQGDVEGFLTQASFETLHAPLEGQAYALGWHNTERPWARGEDGTGRILLHNGTNTMWYCVAWLAPERGRAYIAVCNAGGEPGKDACDAVVTALLEHDRK